MYGMILLLVAVTSLSIWVQKRRVRKDLERALGHSVRTEQVMSLTTWMRVPASEQKESIAPTYRLYSPESAALTAFLGGFLGAGVVVGLNVKQQRSGGLWLVPPVIGLLAMIALVAIIMSIQGGASMTKYLLTPVQVLVSYLLAEFLQGRAFLVHKAAGGAVQPWWKALLIGLSATAIVVIFSIAVSKVPS